MPRAINLILLGGAAAILASPALAQPAAEVARRDAAALAGATSTSVANGPNDSLLKSSRVPDFQLLADGDDSQVSLTLSYGLSAIRSGDQLSSTQGTFTVSGKPDGAGDAKLIGLRGLPTGVEVKGAITHFWGKTHLDGRVKPWVVVAERNCRSELKPAAEEVARKAKDEATREGRDETAVKKAAEEAADAFMKKNCDADSDSGTGAGDFVTKYNPDGLAPLIDDVFPGPIYFVGVEVSGDRGSYDFLDRATFAMESEDHSGYGGSIFGGWLFNRGMSSVTGAYTYKRSWSAQDEVTLCQPVAGTTQTQCITAADGAPERENRSIASLEFRHAFGAKAGSFSTVAIAPELSFDLENDAYSVSLPVYLAGDGEGKLRGGIRAVYLNEENAAGGRDDDFTLSLFVGVPFSVFAR